MKVKLKVTIMLNAEEAAHSHAIMHKAAEAGRLSDSDSKFLREYDELRDQVEGIYAGTHVADKYKYPSRD